MAEAAKEKPLHKEIERQLKEMKGQPFKVGGATIMQRGNTVVVMSGQPAAPSERSEEATDGDDSP